MQLRNWRIEQGLTLAQLADRLGVSQSSIYRFEAQLMRPEWDTLAKIKEVTEGAVTPNDFLGEDAA